MTHSLHRRIVIASWSLGISVCLIGGGASIPDWVALPLFLALGMWHSRILKQVRKACADCSARV